MHTRFDKVINRRGTKSLKYDFAIERGREVDELPLWIADMDFKTAPAIINSLQQAMLHGVYGYSESDEAYINAVKGWYQNQFNWTIESDWIVKVPGVVFAISLAIQAFTEHGDSVMIQQPVYYPFQEVIYANERKVISNDLILRQGHYEMDFVDMEKKIIVTFTRGT